MRILLLSEDNSIFDDNSGSRAKILEYASLVDMLFVVVATSFEKNSNKTKQIFQNTWIYKTNSISKFLRIWDVFNLASFEVRAKGIFQADLIICEDQFTSTFAGYLLAKKFKKPLYIFLSESNERKLFNPTGLKNLLLSKILWFVLASVDCIKVDNLKAKEKLLKNLPTLKIEMIKPSINANTILANSKTTTKEIIGNDLTNKKFLQSRFTAVAFVDKIEQVKLSIDILKKLNTHFPPVSLILLLSDSLLNININYIIKGNIKPFIYTETISDNLGEYLVSSNVFFGISEGEEYEEVLSKACAVGTTIIALESNISKRLIEDNTTGFICPISQKQEIIDYFFTKTLFLIENPATSLSFKMNIPLSFKQQFSNTKGEYIKKLKLSWEECLENYKKDHIKYYRY